MFSEGSASLIQVNRIQSTMGAMSIAGLLSLQGWYSNQTLCVLCGLAVLTWLLNIHSDSSSRMFLERVGNIILIVSVLWVVVELLAVGADVALGRLINLLTTLLVIALIVVNLIAGSTNRAWYVQWLATGLVLFAMTIQIASPILLVVCMFLTIALWIRFLEASRHTEIPEARTVLPGRNSESMSGRWREECRVVVVALGLCVVGWGIAMFIPRLVSAPWRGLPSAVPWNPGDNGITGGHDQMGGREKSGGFGPSTLWRMREHLPEVIDGSFGTEPVEAVVSESQVNEVEPPPPPTAEPVQPEEVIEVQPPSRERIGWQRLLYVTVTLLSLVVALAFLFLVLGCGVWRVRWRMTARNNSRMAVLQLHRNLEYGLWFVGRHRPQWMSVRSHQGYLESGDGQGVIRLSEDFLEARYSTHHFNKTRADRAAEAYVVSLRDIWRHLSWTQRIIGWTWWSITRT